MNRNPNEKQPWTAQDKIALVIVVILLAVAVAGAIWPIGGSACEQFPASAEYIEYRDTTYWAVTEESRQLAGMLRLDELVNPLPVQDVKCEHIRGFLPGGYSIRMAARLRLLILGEAQRGLKALNNTVIRIRPEDEEIVASIVRREMGEDVEICGGSVSSCILYAMDDGTITERLFTKYSDCVGVGFAYYNTDISSSDYLEIAVGYWDDDEYPDLGLMTGSAPEPEKKPEPKPEEKPEASGNCSNNSNSSEQANTADNEADVSSKTCWKIEFDLHFLIQRCLKVFGK